MDTEREAEPRAARAGCLRGIARGILKLGLLIGGVLAFAALLIPVRAVLFAPWALGWDGRPTLTGTWVGPLRSTWASEYHLYLELDWELPSGRGSRAKLLGTARICNRAGREHRMAVGGDADRSAQDVRIDLEARESRYRESLPLRGAWHGDTLRLSSFTSPFGPEGDLRGGRSTVTSTTSDREGRLVVLYPTGLTPDQVPGDDFPEVTLRKGDEAAYRAGCQALQAGR